MDTTAYSEALNTDGEEARIILKRPRPTLSCVECRRKKLKCDRVLPCDQCTKSRKTAQCKYDVHRRSTGAGDVQTRSLERRQKRVRADQTQETQYSEDGRNVQRTPGNHVDLMNDDADNEYGDDLQSRVERIERLLSKDLDHQQPGYDQSVNADYPRCEAPTNGWSGLLVKKDDGSRYHARNQKRPMFLRFEQAMHSVQQLASTPSISLALKATKTWQKALKTGFRQVESLPVTPLEISAYLQACLPPQEVCSGLVTIYFGTFEQLTRILHRPTFVEEYEKFWDSYSNGSGTTEEGFLPRLCAVLITASYVVEEGFPRLIAGGITVTATTVCNLLQSWLTKLDSKRRLTHSTLQMHCLLLLAQSIYSSETDLLANDCAVLVRSAITMGLHRDPSEFRNLSIFQGVIRRRLWATIVEFDIQISHVSGGYPLIRAGEFTTVAPPHIHDEDLFEDMTSLPNPRLNYVSTSIQFQTAISGTVLQRLRFIESTNDIQLPLILDRIVEQGHALETLTKTAYTAISTTSDTENPSHAFNLALTFLALHRPSLSAYISHPSPELIEPTIRLSMTILSHLFSLAAEPEFLRLFHTMCKNDILIAILAICLVLQTPQQNHAYTDGWARSAILNAVEEALDGILKKDVAGIYDLRDLICLAVVVESQKVGDETERRMREALEKVLAAYQCYDVLEDTAGSGPLQASYDGGRLFSEGMEINGAAPLCFWNLSAEH